VTGRGRLLSALWIPLAAVAALALIPPGTTLLSGYALRWYVVGLVLLAVIGRARRWAAISAAGLSAAGGVAVAVRYGDLLLSRSDFMYLTLVAGGLLVAVLGARQFLHLVRAHEPGDPVVVAAVQIGTGLAANWAYFAPALFRFDPRNYHAINWASPFVAELPLLALALAAVLEGVTQLGDHPRPQVHCAICRNIHRVEDRVYLSKKRLRIFAKRRNRLLNVTPIVSGFSINMRRDSRFISGMPAVMSNVGSSPGAGHPRTATRATLSGKSAPSASA
jgi:hypothetical protein